MLFMKKGFYLLFVILLHVSWITTSNAFVLQQQQQQQQQKTSHLLTIVALDQRRSSLKATTKTDNNNHNEYNEGNNKNNNIADDPSRRKVFMKSLMAASIAVTSSSSLSSVSSIRANAYTPDPDPLKESLYLICRVQEATCLQERYIEKKLPPIQKMKLTLRLVDKSYRLLDQVNFISRYIPDDNIVAAVQVGNEAAESLQDAIDFVYEYANKNKASGADNTVMTTDQKEFLIGELTNTREKLFEFVSYLPPDGWEKLVAARRRVEDENKLNVDEFDPDLANDAGIYNPIVLPWKNRQEK